MKQWSRDTRLAIWLLMALIVITVIAAIAQGESPEYPPLASMSSAPNGALAIKLWLKAIGYKVNEDLLPSFDPPQDVKTILMLEPFRITRDDLAALDDWVDAGGTLIAIGDSNTYYVFDHYKFSFESIDDGSDHHTLPESPWTLSPSVLKTPNLKANYGLSSNRNDYVTLMAYQGVPIVVSFDQGKGRVILGTTAYPFTNAGLKESGNPSLVLNLIALTRSKGALWFDEWHHGYYSARQIVGPQDFLRRTPFGHAILFTTFSILIVLFMQGRAFGRPLPLIEEIKRRGPMEHITGIANLSRRAAHRSSVLAHYHQQIKRKLAHRYRLDPTMPDEEYVAALAAYNSSIDQNELLNLLKRLKNKNASEAEMVRLAGETSKWIDT